VHDLSGAEEAVGIWCTHVPKGTLGDLDQMKAVYKVNGVVDIWVYVKKYDDSWNLLDTYQICRLTTNTSGILKIIPTNWENLPFSLIDYNAVFVVGLGATTTADISQGLSFYLRKS